MEDSITWTRETITVRMAELDDQIRNDLKGMLGQEDPRTVNLLWVLSARLGKSVVTSHCFLIRSHPYQSTARLLSNQAQEHSSSRCQFKKSPSTFD